MRLVLLAEAETDFDDAIRHYESQEPGLAAEFTDEVLACLDRIRENPRAWTPVSPVAQRAIVRRFPYGIVFRIAQEEIAVAAIMHLRRNPTAWRERLQDGAPP